MSTMKNCYYTGIGSRRTPETILNTITHIAKLLHREGLILRSGGADGADSAFEKGAGESKEIFYAEDATPPAIRIARDHHPAWCNCSDYVKKLHGRNVMQVLGRDLKTPSAFIICWTPDGCTGPDRSRQTGGTGTAIEIAWKHKIPIFNMRDGINIPLIIEEYCK